MKKSALSILCCLAALLFFSSIACSATAQLYPSSLSEPNPAPVAVVAMQLESSGGEPDPTLFNVMVNLLESDVEFDINESTSVSVACNPFASQDFESQDLASQESDDHIYHPVSNISVGLKFAF